ncbi:MAG: hypothetical protein K940chlam3_01207, partial [Chlamydiae bacterium]|nr:hypothetical protein [Chlamydiota bacterium]
FKNLIMYPEWQDRLYAEISEGLRGKEFNYDNINALEHLDNFVWETLRLNPPVVIQTRDAEEELSFHDGEKKVTIPKGTTMAYLHYFAQRDPKLFEDPFTFNPDRFQGERGAELKRDMKTFGYYPHDCCGKWLALRGTIKAALVNMIMKAEVKAYDLEDVVNMKHVGGVILKHDRPLNVVFRRRFD